MGVNTRAILRRAKQMGVTMEMMDKACGRKGGAIERKIRGEVGMSLPDAEKLQELLKIDDQDFGYYFFCFPCFLLDFLPKLRVVLLHPPDEVHRLLRQHKVLIRILFHATPSFHSLLYFSCFRDTITLKCSKSTTIPAVSVPMRWMQ